MGKKPPLLDKNSIKTVDNKSIILYMAYYSKYASTMSSCLNLSFLISELSTRALSVSEARLLYKCFVLSLGEPTYSSLLQFKFNQLAQLVDMNILAKLIFNSVANVISDNRALEDCHRILSKNVEVLGQRIGEKVLEARSTLENGLVVNRSHFCTNGNFQVSSSTISGICEVAPEDLTTIPTIPLKHSEPDTGDDDQPLATLIRDNVKDENIKSASTPACNSAAYSFPNKIVESIIMPSAELLKDQKIESHLAVYLIYTCLLKLKKKDELILALLIWFDNPLLLELYSTFEG